MVNIPDAGTVCFERSPWRIEPWIRNIFDNDIKFYQIDMEFYFVERVFLLKFVGKKNMLLYMVFIVLILPRVSMMSLNKYQ